LKGLLAEKLTERLESLEPRCIPYDFRPRDRQLSARWKEYEKQIDNEQIRLFDTGWGCPTDDLMEENYRLYLCRGEARHRVADQRRKVRKEEADRKRLQAKKSGTQSRSVTRKAA
jgi:hypothetical protein